MEFEFQVREMLLPVFGRESVDEIQPGDKLIDDLGADSLDFVEILYLAEKNFGVVLTVGEIMTGGSSSNADSLFSDGKLTPEGAEVLVGNFPDSSKEIRAGMTKVDLFSLLTVRDLAKIIAEKKGSI